MVDCCGGGGISWGGAGNCTQCSESDWQTQSLLTGASGEFILNYLNIRRQNQEHYTLIHCCLNVGRASWSSDGPALG